MFFVVCYLHLFVDPSHLQYFDLYIGATAGASGHGLAPASFGFGYLYAYIYPNYTA